MSGTSLDGLDMACCVFEYQDQSWSFSIETAETSPYPVEMRRRLSVLHQSNEQEIRKSDIELGRYFGAEVSGFIQRHDLKADFIASHGHTVLHQPLNGITLQIGNGHEIARASGLTVINDFRTQDVKMGGQGAPLVPVGDRFLFHGFDYCLNIGGIANISFEKGEERLAFDICPPNMVLNTLAGRIGEAYDDRGRIAAAGSIIPGLMAKLESLGYYQGTGARSLGREWVERHVFPLLRGYDVPDMLTTFTEHMALRITRTLHKNNAKMLVTGGGAYNDHLVNRIKYHGDAEIVLPDRKTIEYKEAMIFAFLGLLRLKGENNILGSATGAPRDHCAGIVCTPDKKKASRGRLSI
jgi:anhydro-N-acetylmuramic acid kinase